LYCLFYIGPPDAIQEIVNSRLLSAQKKFDDVAFYLNKKRDRKATIDGHDKSFEIKTVMQEERYNWKIMHSDEEKGRVEK